MSNDLSGIGSNLTFTNGVPPAAPYYYITTHLDLSGVKLPDNNDPELTYYFTRDNNLSYLNTDVPYYGWHTIDANAVIGDVVMYTNPDLVESQTLNYSVGGAIFDPAVLAPELVDPVSVIWGGRTGFSAGPVDSNDLKTGVVCFYGHEGGHIPSEPEILHDRRHLAITIQTGPAPTQAEQKEELIVVPEEKADPDTVLESSRQKHRSQKEKEQAVRNGRVVQHEVLNNIRSLKNLHKARAPRVVVNPDISSGTIFVVVKVYPKQF